MSGTPEPTITVDVFKELINAMQTTLEANLGTKIDNIHNRINTQDLRINDLGQRVENLEKHLTYAEVTKSPPKPPTHNTGASTKTNTPSSTKQQEQVKNQNLTSEEIMNRSKHIIGIFPITTEDIERNRSETMAQTLINTASEFLQYEMGFRQDQIEEMDITKVTKTKKTEGKTLYITLPQYTWVAQIFKCTATIKNPNLKISNYVAPHFYNRYNTLQAHCKTAREMDDTLRTKIIYGHSDIILQEKKVGELKYTTVDINKYGELPPMDTTLFWPTQELDIPLTTPPKGRPNQAHSKRPHSSPEATPATTIKHKKPKKAKKKSSAEASISDNQNSSDEDTNEIANMHKIITGKKVTSKKEPKESKKN